MACIPKTLPSLSTTLTKVVCCGTSSSSFTSVVFTAGATADDVLGGSVTLLAEGKVHLYSSSLDIIVTGEGSPAYNLEVDFANLTVDQKNALCSVIATTCAPGAGQVIVSTDADNDIIVGTDGGAYYAAAPVVGNTSVVTPFLAEGRWLHDDGTGTTVNIRSTSADAGNVLTMGANGGSHLSIASVRAVERISTLVKNPDGSYTYTDEGGTPTVISGPSEVTGTVPGHIIAVHNDGEGNLTDIKETVTSLVEQPDGSIVYTSETGAQTVIALDTGGSLSVVSETIPGSLIARHNNGEGFIVDINETVTSLADNGDGSYTYTSEDGTDVSFISSGGNANISISDGVNTEDLDPFNPTDDTIIIESLTDEAGSIRSGSTSALVSNVGVNNKITNTLKIATAGQVAADTSVEGDVNTIALDANGMLYVPNRTNVTQQISGGSQAGSGIRKSVMRKADGNLHTIAEADSYYVNQDTTGLGAVGDIVALKPALPVGTYELAQADVYSNVAIAVGVIETAAQLRIVRDFQEVPGHAFSNIGEMYILSTTTPGAIVPASDYASAPEIVQHILTPMSASVVDIVLSEAQIEYDNSAQCCDIQTQASHGLTRGVLVYNNAGTWEPADASNAGVVMVTEVIDANTFRIGLSACMTGVVGTLGGTSYVAVPTSQITGLAASAGGIVDRSTLVSGDEFLPVAISPVDGCLMVNMATASSVFCAECGAAEPGEPPIEYVWAETFEGDGVTCGLDHSTDDYFEDAVSSTFVSTSGGCHLENNIPCATASGTFSPLSVLFPTPLTRFRLQTIIGFVNADGFTMSDIVTIREDNGSGTQAGFSMSLRFGNNTSGFYGRVHNNGGGLDVNYYGSDGGGGFDNTWYRITLEAQLSSATGVADGSYRIVVEEMDGAVDGAAPINVVNVLSEQVTRDIATHPSNAVSGINYARLAGGYAASAGAGCILPDIGRGLAVFQTTVEDTNGEPAL